jgi:hypothetical protein
MVVPGIMGSELYDTLAGRTIWGLEPATLVSALSAPVGGVLSRLAVTDEDARRVKPVGLVRFPTHLAWLKGLEPYTRLTVRLREVVRRPDAVAEFPYDWRLSVAHNARLLADAVHRHLTTWRRVSDRPDARIVLVAHSMGGLLCQAMAGISGATNDVRSTITLGTPFDGAAAAALMLAEPGDGVGVGIRMRRALTAAARTMPGVYDLLPAYGCVDTGDHVKHLTVDDIVALGGQRDLAETAVAHRTERTGLRQPGHHRALIGVDQPTISTLRLSAGAAAGTFDTFQLDPDGELRRDRHGRLERFPGGGDATVPRNSALPHKFDPMVLGQQHTTLAHSDEAITFIRDVVVHGRVTDHPRLGEGNLGLVVPDLITPGEEWLGELTGIDPMFAKISITNSGTLIDAPPPPAHHRDGRVCFTAVVDRPGLYRVRVDGGATPVVQYVLALP